MQRVVEGVRAAVVLVLALHVHHHFKGPPVDYLGLAAASGASWAGVPGPGESVLIAEALFAASHDLDIISVIGVAWIGAAAGGMLGWLVGLKGGRALFTARGPLHGLRVRTIARGEDVFARHPVLAIYLTPSWVAGIHRPRTAVYLIVNAVTSAIWAVAIGLGAYFAGPPVLDVVNDLGTATGLLLVAAVLAGVVAEVMRRRRRANARG